MAIEENVRVQRQYSIRVHTDSDSPAWFRLTRILEELLPVKLQSAEPGIGECTRGVVMEHVPEEPQDGDLSSFSCPEYSSNTGEAGNGSLIDGYVHFTDDPHVPFPFRGRLLNVKFATEPAVWSPVENGACWREPPAGQCGPCGKVVVCENIDLALLCPVFLRRTRLRTCLMRRA